MNSPSNEPMDEVAAAEAELKAAQEKLDAAKARQAAARSGYGAGAGAGASASAAAAAEEAASYETAGGMGQGGAWSGQNAGGAAGAQGAQNAQGAAGAQGANAYAGYGGYGAQTPDPGAAQGAQASNQYGYSSPNYGYSQQTYGPQQQVTPTKDHVAAGLLAIFLGALGIHKFYLGYNTSGFIMLAVSILGGIFTISIATWAVWIIAIIEGIIYLTKSQSDFEQIYVLNKREWF